MTLSITMTTALAMTMMLLTGNGVSAYVSFAVQQQQVQSVQHEHAGLNKYLEQYAFYYKPIPQVKIGLQHMPLRVDNSIAFDRTVNDYSQSIVSVNGKIAFDRTYDSISSCAVPNVKVPYEMAVHADHQVAFDRSVHDYSASVASVDPMIAFGRTYDSIGAWPVARVMVMDRQVPVDAVNAQRTVTEAARPITSLLPWMPADASGAELAAQQLEESFSNLKSLFKELEDLDHEYKYAQVQVMAGQDLVKPIVEDSSSRGGMSP